MGEPAEPIVTLRRTDWNPVLQVDTFCIKPYT
jgi:hypothetical protein